MHYANIMFTTIGLGFLVGLAVGVSACVPYSNPDHDHCARQGGDTTCMAKFGKARPYCVMCGDDALVNDGCVEDEPTDLECYSPCGEMQSSEENSSCIAVGEGNGDGDGDGDGDGVGDGDGETMACTESADCADSAKPICDPDSGECVGCDGMPDDPCAGLGDGSTPVCANGMCVQCDADDAAACKDDKPICEMNTCVACTKHDQCPDSACNLSVGNCIEQVMYVDGSDADCDDMGVGSKAMPYCTLGVALSNNSNEAVVFIHEKDGEVYQGANTVDKTLVLFGVPDEDGARPILQELESPALVVGQSGSLSLRDVQISGSNVEGLRVAGKAWIEQSLIVNNVGGGIVVDGGTLIVENCFVGGDVSDVSAVNVMSGSATITYATLAAGYGTAAALGCADGTNTVVRNSLLVARTDEMELQCGSAVVNDSALEQTVPGNVVLDPMKMNWFEDYKVGDFHLTDKSPEAINTAAKWKSGDPVTDIDGDPRPKIDGGPDFAGADVPL